MPDKVLVQDLRKRYEAVQAVDGVSLCIEDGEIFGLIGPNGAGKTTTLECIIGLREPDAGTVEVCGLDARRHPRAVKARIGAALQTTALQDKLTPREALALFGSFYRNPVPPAELIERFGLAEKADAPFDTLSGGQRQRLALALAFVNRPELVFLDEPTTGLDARSRRDLHGEIRRMRDEGHTVLLTTHDMSEAETLCDRIAVIHHGRIAVAGPTREIVGRTAALPIVTVAASAPLDASALASLAGVSDLECRGDSARFRTADPNASIAALVSCLSARGIGILELHVTRGTLEDVYLELTGSPADGGSDEAVR